VVELLVTARVAYDTLLGCPHCRRATSIEVDSIAHTEPSANLGQLGDGYTLGIARRATIHNNKVYIALLVCSDCGTRVALGIGVECTHRLTTCVVYHTFGIGVVIDALTLVNQHRACTENILKLLDICLLLARLALVEYDLLLAYAYQAVYTLLLEVGGYGNLLAVEHKECRRLIYANIPIACINTKVGTVSLG
jgi:hypothetical protein